METFSSILRMMLGLKFPKHFFFFASPVKSLQSFNGRTFSGLSRTTHSGISSGNIFQRGKYTGIFYYSGIKVKFRILKRVGINYQKYLEILRNIQKHLELTLPFFCSTLQVPHVMGGSGEGSSSQPMSSHNNRNDSL